MRQAWDEAPTWLRVLAALGAPVCVVGVLLGLVLLLLPGPGLLLLLVGAIGAVPWIILLLGRSAPSAGRTP